MADEQEIDKHLVAVVNEVLDAVYQAKQVAWSASPSPLREELRELVAFLIDQSGRFMVAEESIGGRAPGMASPSTHNRGNLVVEAGSHHAAVSLLTSRVEALARHARTRAASIGDAPEAQMLSELADGLEARARRLQPS